MSSELILVIILALIFEFINGSQSAGNIVATMISSRAFSPRVALFMAALAEFAAPFLFGTLVAKTISGSIVDSQAVTLNMLIACLAGAIGWSVLNWLFGIPSSSTHSLIGGLLGSVWSAAGLDAVQLQGLYRVLIALLVSPLIGFVIGFMSLRILYFLVRNATPRVNEVFRRSQIFTALSLAFSYGANDAQKTMGMITLGLISGGVLKEFVVPFWVIVISIGTTALGTLFGGWRSIRMLGGKFYKIRPVHSLAAQITSAFVILGASLIGLPVSTTQVVSSSIIGVGSAEGLGKVRWSVADDILTAWVVTIPATALFSAGIYWLIHISQA